MKKKNGVGGISLSNFKTYIGIVINTVWYWWRDRLTDQWSRTENSQIDLHKYVQLIFDKGTKAIQWRKNRLFKKWCWKIVHPYVQAKTEPQLVSFFIQKLSQNASWT